MFCFWCQAIMGWSGRGWRVSRAASLDGLALRSDQEGRRLPHLGRPSAPGGDGERRLDGEKGQQDQG